MNAKKSVYRPGHMCALLTLMIKAFSTVSVVAFIRSAFICDQLHIRFKIQWKLFATIFIPLIKIKKNFHNYYLCCVFRNEFCARSHMWFRFCSGFCCFFFLCSSLLSVRFSFHSIRLNIREPCGSQHFVAPILMRIVTVRFQYLNHTITSVSNIKIMPIL